MSLSLASFVDAQLAIALQAAGLPVALARAVPSQRPEFGDFQCQAALIAASGSPRPARAIAEDIAMYLRREPSFSEVSVAGPGFINLRLSAATLAQALCDAAADANMGVADEGHGRPVVLDFGGPNTAKPLHVGHLRSLALGESLRRMLTATGWVTHADAHLGDWGLQMGMLSAAIRRMNPTQAWFHPAGTEGYPAAAPVTLAELEQLYPEAAAACRADPERMAEARADTAALQAGDPGLLALWAALRALSLRAQVRDFDRLGAHFDTLHGESDVRDALGPLVARLTAAGVATPSEGALVIHLENASGHAPLPPLLLAKSDGAALYATTDLATLEARVKAYPGLSRVVYVVDQRQALHFSQVFAAARCAGIADGVDLIHVGFGTVNGPGGKPFKTRDGGVARLSDLLDDAVARAAERLAASGYGAALDEAGRAELAQQVGVAAVTFADLSGDRLSGYVFDLDRMVAFEGRTGPYLQYACVRLRSLLAKAAGVPMAPVTVTAPAERDLAMACLRFGAVIGEAARLYQPGVVAEYAFTLAQHFSRFYGACPVLAAPDEITRGSRLSLCLLTERVLARCLYLLGIAIPKAM